MAPTMNNLNPGQQGLPFQDSITYSECYLPPLLVPLDGELCINNEMVHLLLLLTPPPHSSGLKHTNLVYFHSFLTQTYQTRPPKP